MFARMILFVFVVTLAGCSTAPKKQAGQSQPMVTEEFQETYQQESYSKGYDANGTWSFDSYEKPVEKSYSGSSTRLSPKQIQRALKKSGFYQGPIDGKIGPKTKESIRKFQKAKGLKADGIAGKRTSAELNEYLSR